MGLEGQEQVDQIFKKAALVANAARIPLAKIAVEKDKTFGFQKIAEPVGILGTLWPLGLMGNTIPPKGLSIWFRRILRRYPPFPWPRSPLLSWVRR